MYFDDGEVGYDPSDEYEEGLAMGVGAEMRHTHQCESNDCRTSSWCIAGCPAQQKPGQLQ